MTVTVGCEHAHWCADCLVTTCTLYKRVGVMDKVVVVAVQACFVARRLREVELMRWRRRHRMRRCRAFAKWHPRQRLVFVMMLAELLFGLHGCGATIRSVWCKERSSRWWKHIVSCFTPQDWLQNFHKSKDTFAYLCDQLRSSISKSDTVMMKAISTERQVAITL